jgi:putative methionine-R-sulfoxide reductase with GAF domain
VFLDYDVAEETVKQILFKSDAADVLQNVVDYLYKYFDKYSWVGIYLVEGKYLVLGPWNGEQATEHTKIPVGKGICGSAAQSGKTEVVADVSKDDRYLACFVSTRSEIIVPIKKNGVVVGEIDIDSDIPSAFDNSDAVFLEKVADMISNIID